MTKKETNEADTVRRRIHTHIDLDSLGIEQPADLHVNPGTGVYLHTAIEPQQQFSITCTIS